MSYINLLIVATLIAAVAFMAIYATLGKSYTKKILAVNTVANYIVVFIVFMGYINNEASFIDIALIYATLNFITTVGFLRYFKLSKKSQENL